MFNHSKVVMKLQPINLERFGAVVVDMQPYFLEEISSSDKSKLFIYQKKILEICAKRDYPIISLEFSPDRYGKINEELKSIIKSAPRYNFLEKDIVNGFSKIEEQIEKWDIDELCFMGIYASYCVKETASSAISKGKRILTTRELIANRISKQEEFDACIPWFQKNGMHEYTDLVSKITSSN